VLFQSIAASCTEATKGWLKRAFWAKLAQILWKYLKRLLSSWEMHAHTLSLFSLHQKEGKRFNKREEKKKKKKTYGAC